MWRAIYAQVHVPPRTQVEPQFVSFLLEGSQDCVAFVVPGSALVAYRYGAFVRACVRVCVCVCVCVCAHACVHACKCCCFGGLRHCGSTGESDFLALPVCSAETQRCHAQAAPMPRQIQISGSSSLQWPSHHRAATVLWVLCSTHPQPVPSTLSSRGCSSFLTLRATQARVPMLQCGNHLATTVPYPTHKAYPAQQAAATRGAGSSLMQMMKAQPSWAKGGLIEK